MKPIRIFRRRMWFKIHDAPWKLKKTELYEDENIITKSMQRDRKRASSSVQREPSIRKTKITYEELIDGQWVSLEEII